MPPLTFPGPRRGAAMAAALGGAAAAFVVERRHLRSLARDSEYARLTAPLGGRPFRVVSADGTWLYAEAFGAEDGPTLVTSRRSSAQPIPATDT